MHISVKANFTLPPSILSLQEVDRKAPSITKTILLPIAEAKQFPAGEVETYIKRVVKPLPVYNSLMVPAIVAHILEDIDGGMDEMTIRSLMTPATLHGFQRFTSKDSIFPVVLDGFPGFSAKGLGLFGLTPGQRGRIDHHERSLYPRETRRHHYS